MLGTFENRKAQFLFIGFSVLKEKVKNEQLDCIFVSQYSVPTLSFIPIGKDELMLVTPKDHPLSYQITVSLSNINNEQFVLSSDGLDYETGKIFELNNIKPKIQYRILG